MQHVCFFCNQDLPHLPFSAHSCIVCGEHLWMKLLGVNYDEAPLKQGNPLSVSAHRWTWYCPTCGVSFVTWSTCKYVAGQHYPPRKSANRICQ